MAESRSSRRDARDPRLLALAEDSGYEILGRIGAGGMGIVYRAHDADGNDVAIKLLRHEIADDAQARERLAREVTAQKLVRNDNIVRILDAELDSSDAFVVTEFIPGPTLDEAVRSHGGLHPEAVREIGLVMGETLRDIHRAGVIHRDLKPSNVMLRGATEGDLSRFDPDGDRLDPVIIDFGIAIAAEESRLTSTGLVMGTAAYLDPEVIRSDHTGEAGDWWAWAALLSFAATGRDPFGSGRADLVFLRAERGEIDVDGLPTELADWLRTALRSVPAERPAPEDLIARLAELDLTRYPDPGDTELLDAGSRTAVLPAIGAAAPGSGSADPTGEVSERTPAATSDSSAGSQDQPTEMIPTITTPAEHPTEALPRIDSAAESATEALPVIGAPTMALPVVPAPQHSASQHSAPPPHSPYTQPFPAAQQQAPRPQAASQAPVQDRPHPPYTYPQQQNPQQQHPGQYPPGAAGLMTPYGPWPEPPPRRPLLVWIGHLLLVSLAAIAPYMSLVVLLLLGALARTWERSHQSVAAQRMRGASGSGPRWTTGLASPFRFLVGLCEIALQALLPLVLGVLVGIAVDASWTLLQGAPPPDGVAFATAMAITLLITWVGLGSRTTRNGAHRMVDSAAPDLLWSAVVVVLLLLLLGAVVFTLLARGGAVDYFPFPSGPRLDDIAIWRR
ncbi:serine/threonine-protein kinase [Brachybacterium paraconglomeratum]|uniref:serine/threonine-protein kinase n=1 Tax=Brachybacterium paraconglomeratum TaxID=173362 RepID=UPI0031EBFCF5